MRNDQGAKISTGRRFAGLAGGAVFAALAAGAPAFAAEAGAGGEAAGQAEGAGAGKVLRVGDCNSDGEIDVADSVFLLLHLFAGGSAPECAFLGDADGIGKVDVSDAVSLLKFLFSGGPAPYRPSVSCLEPRHCWFFDWLVDCYGQWRCDCGECQPVCDFQRCGDGVCDVEGGETPQTCARDCTGKAYPPVCAKIGTRSEGWYDAATGELLGYAFCAECVPVCRACGSFSEGWYDSCTGERIAWADCDCE